MHAPEPLVLVVPDPFEARTAHLFVLGVERFVDYILKAVSWRLVEYRFARCMQPD